VSGVQERRQLIAGLSWPWIWLKKRPSLEQPVNEKDLIVLLGVFFGDA
jgi:hypothetical protein